MLSKKEFHGELFYAWAAQQYEAARVYLKNCGRPKDEYDRWLIEQAKFDAVLFKRFI